MELREVSKSYGATRALDEVTLGIERGEVHVLAGSNGAGKSTLIRILSGAAGDYAGQVMVDGCPLRLAHPRDAARAGIATIHQELSLVGSMSVADNLALGDPGPLWKARRRPPAREILAAVGLSIDPDVLVERLPLSVRQLVEIARALASGARVLVMDEPTSALGEREVERLFGHVEELRTAGRGILYVSHRMEEIGRLADRVSVLRDGRLVATAAKMAEDDIVRHMVGRSLGALGELAPPREELALRVEGLCAARDRVRLEGIDLRLRRGEILGVYGLEGSGASLLPHAIFGAIPRSRGSIHLEGRALSPTPAHCIARGMILLAGDRAESIVGASSLLHNASLSALRKLSRLGWVDRRAEREAVEAVSDKLSIAPRALHEPVWKLSGGNQQKVALARGLLVGPRVLLLDEPTRGIDVSAKRDLHAHVADLARGGAAILLASSELEELMALCHRVVVMSRGRVACELSRRALSRERLVAAAMGHEEAS